MVFQLQATHIQTAVAVAVAVEEFSAVLGDSFTKQVEMSLQVMVVTLEPTLRLAMK
jgi:hypothetical protein